MTGQMVARRAGPAWAARAIGVPMNLALGLSGYYPVLSLWLLGTAVVQDWAGCRTTRAWSRRASRRS